MQARLQCTSETSVHHHQTMNKRQKKWTNKPLKLDYLHIFGCRAWCVIDKIKLRTKLDPKGIECIFVGYAEEHNGYKV